MWCDVMQSSKAGNLSKPLITGKASTLIFDKIQELEVQDNITTLSKLTSTIMD